jgi:MoxR-like ATPase
MSGTEGISPESFARIFGDLRANIGRVIKGKPDVIDLVLTAYFAEGHVLIEDVPGVGKTQLARALAASVDSSWARIQFTPDLLPSDVTGVTIFNQASRAFEFHRGPVFANIVLADEINRASPKTQSALLEVMEEQQVSVDATSHAVPRPFMVIATQNPVDMDGTYPLPEAQLDRFLVRTAIGYPSHRAELEIVLSQDGTSAASRLRPVLSAVDARSMVQAVTRVAAGDNVADYLVRLVSATRSHRDLRLGASTRASVALLKAAKARALASGRHFVTPDDIKSLAVPVLAHRLILTAEAEISGVTTASVVEGLLRETAVPTTPLGR